MIQPVHESVRHAQWPLPQGVVDLVYQDAASKRELESALAGCFRAWSYDELIPPSFEYADTLASEAGVQLAEEMYRFTDRDGRTLALRPDLTIPAARVAATRLYDQPMPLRLFYIGSVFRYEAPQAGRQREFTQAGIELIGAGTPAADAEVLALTVEALAAAGLGQFQVALGQMAFFRGLLAELDAPAAARQTLQSAIDRKNPADLAAMLDQLAIAGPLRQAFLLLA
jgi:ATP phosphoribosyltransferase regulatory subunit